MNGRLIIEWMVDEPLNAWMEDWQMDEWQMNVCTNGRWMNVWMANEWMDAEITDQALRSFLKRYLLVNYVNEAGR